MTSQFFTEAGTLERLRVGPLSNHLDGFAALLAEQGFKKATGREKLRLLGYFSRWLNRRGLGLEKLDERVIDEFARYRRKELGRVDRGCLCTLRAVIRYLRDNGVVDQPAHGPADDVDRLVREYHLYLVQERGLAAATCDYYVPFAHRFLAERFGSSSVQLEQLCPSEIRRFILTHADAMGPGRVKLMVTSLRSFLRFLLLRGSITVDLSAAVPSVPDWRQSTLPKSLEPEQVECVLRACDRSCATGLRDYALLLVLARLGLRAGEIVAMSLEDLDWEAGELTVRGKGSRRDRLPLPEDVGAALVTYLTRARPACSTRMVFVNMRAPHRGFASSVAVCTVVRKALAQAGLDPPRKGAHLLRHSLAVRMLRHGASLAEIGDVLRHDLPSSTEIYAKVDLDGLRALALPWPGGAP